MSAEPTAATLPELNPTELVSPRALRSLDDLRRAEMLDLVTPWLSPGMEVLELGGGSGFQASLLHAWGARVISIDVAGRPPAPHQSYVVQEYDGSHIPFADGSFDVVYSSNVLEHVSDLASLLPEIQRVLKHGGLAIHLVPSATWRLWTTVAHYLRLPHLIVLRLSRRSGTGSGRPSSRTAPRSGQGLRRVLLPGAHGEHTTACGEIYHFSRRRWLRLLDDRGTHLVDARGSGFFYSAYLLAPRIMQLHRRQAAHVLGSTCHVIVLRKHERSA